MGQDEFEKGGTGSSPFCKVGLRPARHLPARALQWQAGREPGRSGEAGGGILKRRIKYFITGFFTKRAWIIVE